MDKSRKLRCPWCGEESIGVFEKTNDYRRVDPPKCPDCHRQFSDGKTHYTLFAIAFCIMPIIMIFLMVVFFFLKKYVFMIPAFLLSVIFSKSYKYYFKPSIKVEGSYSNIMCFDFTFISSIHLNSFKNGGHWNKRLYFRNGSIFGVKFDTDNKKYQESVFAVVFDKIQYGKDNTNCICGFILPDSAPKDILKTGLKFTVIDNGKEIAAGEITKGVFNMTEK